MEFTDFPNAIHKLRQKSNESVYPADEFFSSLADAIEELIKTVDYMDEAFDDNCVTIDRLQDGLRNIKRQLGRVVIGPPGKGGVELGKFIDELMMPPKLQRTSEISEDCPVCDSKTMIDLGDGNLMCTECSWSNPPDDDDDYAGSVET